MSRHLCQSKGKGVSRWSSISNMESDDGGGVEPASHFLFFTKVSVEGGIVDGLSFREEGWGWKGTMAIAPN